MREDKREGGERREVMKNIKSSLSKKQNRNIRLSEDRLELLETIKELVKKEVQKRLKEMNFQVPWERTSNTREDKDNASTLEK